MISHSEFSVYELLFNLQTFDLKTDLVHNTFWDGEHCNFLEER